MQFKKYQHVERYGTSAVEGIEFGTCHIFAKVDGTNASVWLGDEGEVCAGSRNRKLSLEEDNQGFYKHIIGQENIEVFLKSNPNIRLYGEWLVPHTLKTYREDAWREFYVFDVIEGEGEDKRYLPYEEYQPILEHLGINYIPPLAIIENPEKENLVNQLDKTGQFLVEDGKGLGEGIVIKNYDFVNKYGNIVWAKMVTNRFKENHAKNEPTHMEGTTSVEEKIVNKYVDESLISKEYAKIYNQKDGWRSELIPMLLGRVYHALVTEHIWDAIKKFNKPTIDFYKLRKTSTHKIKQIKSELF